MNDDFELLDGVDAPRPLPPHLRSRLEAALAGHEPVAMPAAVRRRVEQSLTRRPAWSRGVAVAAALLLVVASAVVLTRSGAPDRDEFVATGPPVTTLVTPKSEDLGAAPAAEAAPSDSVAPTTAAKRTAAPRVTPTTAGAAPAAASPGASESRAGGGAAAAAAAPAPQVSVSPSTARRGEEVTARAGGFSTPTVAYTLRAPSGRAVLEGEARPEFRFTVPLFEETGRYTLIVESTDRTQRAEAYLDVVVA